MKRIYTYQHAIPGIPETGRDKAGPYRDFVTIFCLTFISLTLFMYFLSLLYNWGLPTLPHDPLAIDLGAVFTTPNRHHWLGTDHLGRDIFSRLIMSTQAYTVPSFLAILVAVTLGVGFGAVWGYYGDYKPRLPFIGPFLPPTKVIITYLASVINSFPRFVLILMVCAIFSTNIYFIMLIVGITSAPKIAEVVRNKVVALKEQNFIEAAQAIGVKPAGIIFRHIIWHHCKTMIVVQVTYLLGYVVFIETSLSYLGGGFGVQEPNCSWGNMLASGKEYFFEGLFWPSIFPTLAIIMTILSFTLLGDVINQRLKLQKERG